MYVYIKKFL